jgi:transcriptional regulator with PAS, ATPase and Fis domain
MVAEAKQDVLNLFTAIKKKNLEKIYNYRLGVDILLPPLRDRKEDIHFVSKLPLTAHKCRNAAIQIG